MAETSFTGMLKLSLPGIDPKTIPTLLPDHVGRLPPKVLVLLYQLGEPQDLGDLTLLTIKDSVHHSTILRCVQWLVHGEYSPFKENSAVVNVTEGGDKPAVVYEPRSHELNPFLSTTEETHALFVQEMKLYVFAIVSEFKDLQAHTARKLRHQIPLYAREIVELLCELSKTGVLNRFAEVDPELANYVSKRIACCRQVLVKDRTLLPFLRGVVDSQEQFMNLIKTSDEARINKCIEELTKSADPEAETAGLLDAFNKSCLAAKPAEPVRPPPTNGHIKEEPRDATPIRGAESLTVFNAIADGKIVVAPRVSAPLRYGSRDYKLTRYNRTGTAPSASTVEAALSRTRRTKTSVSSRANCSSSPKTPGLQYSAATTSSCATALARSARSTSTSSSSQSRSTSGAVSAHWKKHEAERETDVTQLRRPSRAISVMSVLRLQPP